MNTRSSLPLIISLRQIWQWWVTWNYWNYASSPFKFLQMFLHLPSYLAISLFLFSTFLRVDLECGVNPDQGHVGGNYGKTSKQNNLYRVSRGNVIYFLDPTFERRHQWCLKKINFKQWINFKDNYQRKNKHLPKTLIFKRFIFFAWWCITSILLISMILYFRIHILKYQSFTKLEKVFSSFLTYFIVSRLKNLKQFF